MKQLDKDKETKSPDIQHDNDVIDQDLYEEFTDEELLELVEDARKEALRKSATRKKKKKPKTRFPKWVIWLIAIAMVFNIIALLPQTYSIPAVKFLKTSAALSANEEIKQYKQSVAVIETDDGKGTGFLYDEAGLVLTNYHVIEGYDSVTVAFPKHGLFEGTVLETYPDIDLAIMKVDTEDSGVPVLPLATAVDAERGEEVYFIGNPLRFTGIANEGEVLGFTNVKSKEKSVVMMHAPVYKGNSGSPVINKSGHVIGVVFATLFDDDEGRVGLFIPVDYLYEAQPDD